MGIEKQLANILFLYTLPGDVCGEKGSGVEKANKFSPSKTQRPLPCPVHAITHPAGVCCSLGFSFPSHCARNLRARMEKGKRMPLPPHHPLLPGRGEGF